MDTVRRWVGLDVRHVRRLAPGAQEALYRPPSGDLEPWASALVGRLGGPRATNQWILVVDHACSMGDASGTAVERWVAPPLVEAIVELAEEWAVVAPRPHADLRIGAWIFQRLLGHAVAHRDWSGATAGLPVRVDRYLDGLCIASPGGLVAGVELRDGVLRGRGARSPGALAVLQGLGLRSHAGEGACVRMAAELGYRLAWRTDENSVIADLQVDVDGLAKPPEARRQHVPCDVHGDRVVELLGQLGTLTAVEISTRLNIPRSTLKSVLKKLVRQRRIERTQGPERSPDQSYRLPSPSSSSAM